MKIEVNSNQIQQMLPHRYPFLLVDKVIDYSVGKIVTMKNLTVNEPFFQGHFPSEPILPGVLIVEIAAQSAALMYIMDELNIIDQQSLLDKLKKEGLNISSKVGYLVSIKNTKFINLAVPGDVLEIKVQKSISVGLVSEITFKITNQTNKLISNGKLTVTQR